MLGRVRIRRRFPRVPLFNAVLVRRVDEPQEVFGKLHTLGQGGCMFVSRVNLGVDAKIELLIAFRRGTMRANGRVVYERGKAHEARYEVGVEFVSMTEADQAILTRVLGPRAMVHARPQLATSHQ